MQRGQGEAMRYVTGSVENIKIWRVAYIKYCSSIKCSKADDCAIFKRINPNSLEIQTEDFRAMENFFYSQTV